MQIRDKQIVLQYKGNIFSTLCKLAQSKFSSCIDWIASIGQFVIEYVVMTYSSRDSSNDSVDHRFVDQNYHEIHTLTNSIPRNTTPAFPRWIPVWHCQVSFFSAASRR